jgi:very-short-patch-repair endonuclease
MLLLLEKNSFVFVSPERLERGFDVTPMTPIEESLAEEFRQIGLKYMPQYRISNMILDFLVECHGAKVAVECDGRGFHQKDLDARRDERIRELGYETIRFTGSEIYRDLKKCALKVKEYLENKSKKAIRYKLDKDLDESQLKAVQTKSGAVRVLAQAGSGKTKALINRIISLINEGVDPETILALAFNRKAAEEIIERLFTRRISGVEVRTFHSFGDRIIRKLSWELHTDITPFRKLLERVLKEQGIEIKPKRHIDPLDRYFKAIIQAKADLIPQSLIEVEDEEIEFPPIFDRFLDKEIKAGIYSFDDQIYMAVRLLLSDEKLRREIQKRYEYVLIDEYQDLTNSQIMLANLVALPECNLFIVGDDDQMIYGWRHARIEHILNFPQEYPTSDTTTLSTNYRCAKKIVRHSARLIK